MPEGLAVVTFWSFRLLMPGRKGEGAGRRLDDLHIHTCQWWWWFCHMYFFHFLNHISHFLDSISLVWEVHLLDLSRCIFQIREAPVEAQMICKHIHTCLWWWWFWNMYFFDSMNQISLFCRLYFSCSKSVFVRFLQDVFLRRGGREDAQMIYTCTPVFPSNCVLSPMWQMQVLMLKVLTEETFNMSDKRRWWKRKRNREEETGSSEEKRKYRMWVIRGRGNRGEDNSWPLCTTPQAYFLLLLPQDLTPSLYCHIYPNS